jgi:phage replication-related protein YjqB (UPF0714/DUF867 family)
LDLGLKKLLSDALKAVGVESHLAGHPYHAVHPRNICNRGRRGAGVQIELTSALRSRKSNRSIVSAIRAVLHGLG